MGGYTNANVNIDKFEKNSYHNFTNRNNDY